MNRNVRTLGQITLATATVLSLLAIPYHARRHARMPMADGPDFTLLSDSAMDTMASAINDRGDVAGTAVVGGGAKVLAFRVVGERFETLPQAPGLDAALGQGIAPDGTVVGLAGDDQRVRAVAWGNGECVILPPADADAAAMAVNGKGQAVGGVARSNDMAAVLWQKGAKPQVLGKGLAYAIDSRGRVAGVGVGKQGIVAMVWENGKSRALPAPKQTQASAALGISGSFVVGAALTGDGKGTFVPWDGVREAGPMAVLTNPWHAGRVLAEEHPVAVVWQDGKPQVLPGVGGKAGIAYGVNAKGVVVGVSADAKGEPVATVWVNGKARDLNAVVPPDSGWRLVNVAAINNDGFVVGTAVKGERFSGFRLGPVGR